MYTWVKLKCVLQGIRTAERFCSRDGGSAHRQKQFADESSFAGDTLTDSSKKNVPTKRGVVSATPDEDPTQRCGGGSINVDYTAKSIRLTPYLPHHSLLTM